MVSVRNRDSTKLMIAKKGQLCVQGIRMYFI